MHGGDNRRKETIKKGKGKKIKKGKYARNGDGQVCDYRHMMLTKGRVVLEDRTKKMKKKKKRISNA